MSHELTMREDGTAEMAYVGKTPWHGLGQALDPDAGKAEWCKAAGFDWDVLSDPVEYMAGEERMKMPGRYVLHRSDNHAPLSIVSDRYKVVQPAQIMEYFDELVQRAGFKLETAGTLYGGKQFWALANIGEDSYILSPADKIKGRLLVATSLDMSIPTLAKYLSERVVCHNTLSRGLTESGGTSVRVRHTIEFNPDLINEQLGIELRDRFAKTIDMLRQLAERPMTSIEMASATVDLMSPDSYKLTDDELGALIARRPVQEISRLSIGRQAIGAELDGAHGTRYAWLNAVTQYVDHEVSGADDRRLSRAWFGDGDALKTRALEIAVGLTDGFSFKYPLTERTVGELTEAVEVG